MPTNNTGERLARLEEKVSNIEVKVNSIETKLDAALEAGHSELVTKEEFAQYKATQLAQKLLLSVLTMMFGTLLGYFISNVAR